MMKILLVSPFFFPEKISTGKWNTSLVMGLSKGQCEIDVITSHPLYPSWKPDKCDDKIDGVRIFRGGSFIRYPRSAIFRRLVLEMWFSMFVFWKLLLARKKYDVVIYIFPPILSAILSNVLFSSSTRKIGVVHDLMGVMAKSTNNPVRRMIARTMWHVEKWAFNRCDEIICLSASMAEEVVSGYGIPKSKCSVSYPFITMRSSLEETTFLTGSFPKEYFHIVYSGALGEKQIPDDLIEIMNKIAASNKDVMCHVFSNGPIFECLKSKNTNGKVKFNDLVPEQALEELYKRSNLQIIPQAPGTGSGAFPSKLPNLIEIGVPVFVMCDEDSELDTLMKRVSCSAVTHAKTNDERAADLSQFIEEVRKCNHTKCRESNKELRENVFSIDPMIRDILQE